MVILLRDNIMMVVCTADEVRMRFQFMKNISSLPSIRDSSPSLLQRMPELQGKFEEVSVINTTASTMHKFWVRFL